MNTNVLDIESVYLIRQQNGRYVCRDSVKAVRSAATRYFIKDKAEKDAIKIGGEIEEEILTPETMCLIINEKSKKNADSVVVRRVLEALCDDKISTDYRNPTLGGKKVELKEIIFTAAGRYAEIVYAAYNAIEMYYNLMLSENYYTKYDPELDNDIGMKEYETYYQLARLYEEQLANFAIIYRAALKYLVSALMNGYCNSLKKCNEFIDTFTELVIQDHQASPEKKFEQFIKIGASVQKNIEKNGELQSSP